MFASKPLFSAVALVLALGVSVPAPAEPPHGRHAGKAHKVEKPHKLHPAYKKYLDRRAAWYKHKGNKAELRENVKARKAFRQLPYKEQRIQCQAAYEAFDDFDHSKFRR